MAGTVYRETDSAGVVRLIQGGVTLLVRVSDANYSVVAGETLIEYVALTATRTVTLIDAHLAPGAQVTVKDASGLVDGSHKITLVAPALVPDTDQLIWRKDLAASGEDAVMAVATAAALPTCVAAGSGVGKTLTASGNAALTVDGVAVNNADVILVKDEANPVNNGIYVVTNKGSVSVPFVLTRKTTFDASNETLPGYLVTMTAGTAQTGQYWRLRGGVDDANGRSITTALDKMTVFSDGKRWMQLE